MSEERPKEDAPTPEVEDAREDDERPETDLSGADPVRTTETKTGKNDGLYPAPTTETDRKMELRGNASTDDLLSLDATGKSSTLAVPPNTPAVAADNHYPVHQQSPQVALASLTVNLPTNNSSTATTPAATPRGTPSQGRKPPLKLSLDEATWTTNPNPPVRRSKLRQNLAVGAAKISAIVQKSRTPEFRFRLVLFFLFSCIITLVTFTWYQYQKQMLQLTADDKIRFLEVQRILHFLNEDGEEMLKGTLGHHIPPELNPYDCQVQRYESEPDICMEWKYRARLQVHFLREPNVSCYAIHWESLARQTVLRDCFDLRGSYWYGMGELRKASWPFKNTTLKLQPVITGDMKRWDFGGVLERYWLSSAGVAIRVAPEVPLYVSLNATGKDDLCFEARYDQFPYRSLSQGALPSLDYTICTGRDLKEVHQHMVRSFVRLPMNVTSSEFLQAPLWSTSPKLQNSLTQDALQNYANHIIKHGFEEPGFIVFDSSWQRELGDLEFNSTNIPSPQEILVILQNKGFKILFTVHPYICLDSRSFHNATFGNYLVSDTNWRVPLLTRWRDSVCGIVDITNNASAAWFVGRLEELKKNFRADGFSFEGGRSSFLPRSYNFFKASSNPDGFLPHYANTASQLGSLFGLNFGYRSQETGGYVRLSPRWSDWDSSSGLQSVIPNVLALGLLGYPMVNPGSVGGDVLPANNSVPDNELYMRWLQLAVFMPVLQFSVPPGDYSLREIKVAKVLLKTRKERVLPVMQRCLKQFGETGAPIVRPLWWLAPDDPITYQLDSQFAIGDEIIVAPVLESGKTSRDVYLPPGFWKDEIQAVTRGGGRWLPSYQVPLDKVAYFSRTEDPNK